MKETELKLEGMAPKVLIFAKVVATRGNTIKGNNHEWPLTCMYIDCPASHLEFIKQAAGRLAGTDNRLIGPILFVSALVQIRHSNGLITQQYVVDMLKSGSLPWKSSDTCWMPWRGHLKAHRWRVTRT